jgi:hypothetical protein
MTFTDALSQLHAARRNDDGTKTACLTIKLAALNVAKACDHEAAMRDMRTLPPEEQHDRTFSAVLRQIAQPA